MSNTGELNFDDQVIGDATDAVDGAAVDGGAAAVAAAFSTPEETEEVVEQPEQPELSEFGMDFLNHVAPEHREIVGQYLSPWDAGAQRQFRRYQEQIDSYQQYGEQEDLERGAFLLRQLRDSPETFLTNLQGIVNRDKPQTPQPPAGTSTLAEQLGVPEVFLGNVDPQAMQGLQMLSSLMDKKYGDQIRTQQQAIESMRSMMLEMSDRDRQYQENTRMQNETTKLEQELALLERQYGGFDRQFVLGRIQAGSSPDEAVQAYKAMRQSIINELAAKPTTTPTLSSVGTPVAQQEPDVTQLSDKQVRQMVAQMLAQSGDEE